MRDGGWSDGWTDRRITAYRTVCDVTDVLGTLRLEGLVVVDVAVGLVARDDSSDRCRLAGELGALLSGELLDVESGTGSGGDGLGNGLVVGTGWELAAWGVVVGTVERVGLAAAGASEVIIEDRRGTAASLLLDGLHDSLLLSDALLIDRADGVGPRLDVWDRGEGVRLGLDELFERREGIRGADCADVVVIEVLGLALQQAVRVTDGEGKLLERLVWALVAFEDDIALLGRPVLAEKVHAEFFEEGGSPAVKVGAFLAPVETTVAVLGAIGFAKWFKKGVKVVRSRVSATGVVGEKRASFFGRIRSRFGTEGTQSLEWASETATDSGNGRQWTVGAWLGLRRAAGGVGMGKETRRGRLIDGVVKEKLGVISVVNPGLARSTIRAETSGEVGEETEKVAEGGSFKKSGSRDYLTVLATLVVESRRGEARKRKRTLAWGDSNEVRVRQKEYGSKRKMM
ncbi:hypothetical protein C8F01DRAFT_1092589 [Mycena amicta]|nr:hypothetical protein C8F01DRAFT_1092589 [Mycena amicta]